MHIAIEASKKLSFISCQSHISAGWLRCAGIVRRSGSRGSRLWASIHQYTELAIRTVAAVLWLILNQCFLFVHGVFIGKLAKKMSCRLRWHTVDNKSAKHMVFTNRYALKKGMMKAKMYKQLTTARTGQKQNNGAQLSHSVGFHVWAALARCSKSLNEIPIGEALPDRPTACTGRD